MWDKELKVNLKLLSLTEAKTKNLGKFTVLQVTHIFEQKTRS